MNPALVRLTRRYINRRLFQSLLFVVGVALGVAVGVAIDLANASASRAFALSVDSVTGRTTHQIVGGTPGLPTDLYRRLRLEEGIKSSAPIVQSYVQASNLDDRSFRLLGVDPFAEAAFRSYLNPQNSDAASDNSNLFAMIAQPNTVLISAALADRLDITPGDTLTLQTRTTTNAAVQVVGLLYPDDNLSQQAIDNLLLADIATAQELVGQPGKLTRIDLILPEAYELATIDALLPPNATLTTPAANSDALSQMTDAFEFNLQALSLLALLVGVFLIYNTVTFSVVQRRAVIGILRSLGTTRRQIFTLILSEALILGAIGTAFGLGLGVVLGQGAVRLVSQTINDLYFRVSVDNVTLDSTTLLKGAGIGIAASLTAAIIPSVEATRTAPVGVMRRSHMEQHTRKLLPYLTIGALVLGGTGYLLLRFPTNSILISFIALFSILIASALLTPLALIALIQAALPLADQLFGVLGRMAARGIIRALSRTSIAVAALTLAVSVIVGISTMIDSFRTTVADWLDVTLGADVFISPFYDVGADIEPALADEIGAMDAISRVTTVRTANVIAPEYPDLPPVNVVAPDGNITRRPRRFAWYNGPTDNHWAALEAGYVIVSEPFAFRRDITPEDNTLTLLTDQGPHPFTIVGVYYDYTTDQGTVFMHQDVYRQFYDDPFISAIALDVEAGTDITALIDRLQTGILVDTGLKAQSNRELRQSALEVFDRTFAITVALRLLATIVAFIGILSALLALQLENTHQYGIMRANGMTPGQLRRFTFVQTGLMGIVAGVLALPVGLILALILIEVINVRSFGWSMTLTLNPEVLAQAFVIALAAALAAGIYPAWRLGRLAAAQVIRSE